MSALKEWRSQFDAARNTPPKAGDVLRACNGKVKLTIELAEGKPPFVFARCFIPQIAGAPVGWYCQDMESDSTYGWKCILMTKSRNEVIKRFGVAMLEVPVNAIRVVRPSKAGASLLVEVSEW